ncbi:hypothetical protein BC830DRAFT_1227865 [Chytriomyces sp. MP71]|nr:hypothetical protein BC830DRAFT_1227865 [Chytriomyces sp. MP71]
MVPMGSIPCTVPGCSLLFHDKKQRKEHVFQYHSEPTMKFEGIPEPKLVPRDTAGFLHCPCGGYSVHSVGALKKHARKCGIPASKPARAQYDHMCLAPSCGRSFKTRNALAVHTYEFHSSPKVQFLTRGDLTGECSILSTVIQRDPETRYLHCPCSKYSVLTTAAILKHAKVCSGIPSTPPSLNSELPQPRACPPKRRRVSEPIQTDRILYSGEIRTAGSYPYIAQAGLRCATPLLQPQIQRPQEVMLFPFSVERGGGSNGELRNDDRWSAPPVVPYFVSPVNKSNSLPGLDKDASSTRVTPQALFQQEAPNLTPVPMSADQFLYQLLQSGV